MSTLEDLRQIFDEYSVAQSIFILVISFFVMVFLTVVHEFGHLLPAQLFTKTGRLQFLPFRKECGAKKFLIVASCYIPDNAVENISRWKLALIIAGGPVFDLAFTLMCVFLVSNQNWLGLGVYVGGGIRLLLSILNIIPIPGLSNDGAQFLRVFFPQKVS